MYFFLLWSDVVYYTIYYSTLSIRTLLLHQKSEQKRLPNVLLLQTQYLTIRRGLVRPAQVVRPANFSTYQNSAYKQFNIPQFIRQVIEHNTIQHTLFLNILDYNMHFFQHTWNSTYTYLFEHTLEFNIHFFNMQACLCLRVKTSVDGRAKLGIQVRLGQLV